MRRRVVVTMAFFLIVFVVIGTKLVFVQARDRDTWAQRARDQRDVTVTVSAKRGTIYDRTGLSLAMTVERNLLFVDTKPMDSAARYAALLAPSLELDEAELAAKLQAGQDRVPQNRYVVVAHGLGPDEVDRLEKLKRDNDLIAIAFAPDPVREYPAGDLAASVIGTTGSDDVGISGLEKAYDELLTGTDGTVTYERGRRGSQSIPHTERTELAVRPGDDLVLTLDSSLQYTVERSLLDQVAAQRARGGMAAVMDVSTGAILAMATVQAEAKGELPRLARYNRVVTDTFEPGSTNKVITIASALDNGVITPDTGLTVDSQIRIGSHVYNDDEGHPRAIYTPAQILEHSSNVGTIQIAQQLGADRFSTALRMFGLGQRTALRFPGEAYGLLPSDYRSVSTAVPSASIGYGLSVSALQMLSVYTTLANGGQVVAPKLIDAVIDGAGRRTTTPVKLGNQIVQPQTASVMAGMLAEVVRSGTALCAAVPGYEVAGKTGTARKVLASGQYAEDQTMATFVGFAPAHAPRLSAIVVIDEPDDVYGGRAAAPVFSEVMQDALGLMRIPADRPVPGRVPQWEQAASEARAEGLPCAVPRSSSSVATPATPPTDAPAGTGDAAGATGDTPQAGPTDAPDGVTATPDPNAAAAAPTTTTLPSSTTTTLVVPVG